MFPKIGQLQPSVPPVVSIGLALVYTIVHVREDIDLFAAELLHGVPEVWERLVCGVVVCHHGLRQGKSQHSKGHYYSVVSMAVERNGRLGLQSLAFAWQYVQSVFFGFGGESQCC